MNNKTIAYDILSNAIRNADKNINLDEIAKHVSQEDLAELALLLPQVQLTKKAQEQHVEMLKQQMHVAMENTQNTFETLKQLKDSLHEAMRQAKKGYAYVMWMYIITFYLGIGLIISAVIFAAMDKTILAIAFGTIGLIDIVVYLLKNPPLDLQASRSNYAQLSSALISWFGDMMNLNGYLSTVQQGATFEVVKAVSDKQYENTTKLMEMIDKYCEPGWKGTIPKDFNIDTDKPKQ